MRPWRTSFVAHAVSQRARAKFRLSASGVTHGHIRNLSGKRIAILATNGFEPSELMSR
jgi:hypothetical protein